jgi:glycosyltransferase involved in cell wall biosynthesis
MPKVSVIIATHSRPHLLPRAVKSAFEAGTDVEVIVVDDASTDETSEVCKSIEGIRYVRLDENQHTAGARNVGIMISTGEYISFHDDDDLRFPGSIDKQVILLEANPQAGFCHAPVFLGDEECNPIEQSDPRHLLEGDVFWDLLTRNSVHCLSSVFRKSCLERIGMLDASVPSIDDWDLWVRISEFYPAVVINDPVGIWKSATPFSEQGSSAPANILLKYKAHLQKLMKLKRIRETSEKHRKEIQLKFLNNASDILILLAAEWLPEGAQAYARKCLSTALRINPRRAFRPWTISLLLQSVLPKSFLPAKKNVTKKEVGA